MVLNQYTLILMGFLPLTTGSKWKSTNYDYLRGFNISRVQYRRVQHILGVQQIHTKSEMGYHESFRN